jgi:hypothetical protein
MKFPAHILLLILFFSFSKKLIGQDTIYLNNPSFEDAPRRGGEFSSPIEDWQDCGLVRFPGESPPDIHGGTIPFWNVRTKAYDGGTFLSMVVRDNDTWESISQYINTSINAETCYSFHAYMCVSPKYESRTRKSPDALVNFSTPVELLIWGGNDFCDKKELLARSEPISNLDWDEFSFEFYPTMNHSYITLEAFWKLPILQSYNGHLLIDNLSPIIEISCQ